MKIAQQWKKNYMYMYIISFVKVDVSVMLSKNSLLHLFRQYWTWFTRIARWNFAKYKHSYRSRPQIQQFNQSCTTFWWYLTSSRIRYFHFFLLKDWWSWITSLYEVIQTWKALVLVHPWKEKVCSHWKRYFTQQI